MPCLLSLRSFAVETATLTTAINSENSLTCLVPCRDTTNPSLGRGTQIILHLKEDQLEHLEERKLKVSLHLIHSVCSHAQHTHTLAVAARV